MFPPDAPGRTRESLARMRESGREMKGRTRVGGFWEWTFRMGLETGVHQFGLSSLLKMGRLLAQRICVLRLIASMFPCETCD